MISKIIERKNNFVFSGDDWIILKEEAKKTAKNSDILSKNLYELLLCKMFTETFKGWIGPFSSDNLTQRVLMLIDHGNEYKMEKTSSEEALLKGLVDEVIEGHIAFGVPFKNLEPFLNRASKKMKKKAIFHLDVLVRDYG